MKLFRRSLVDRILNYYAKNYDCKLPNVDPHEHRERASLKEMFISACRYRKKPVLAIILMETSVGRWSVASISIFNFFVVFCMFLETDFFHVYSGTLMKEDSAIYGQKYSRW